MSPGDPEHGNTLWGGDLSYLAQNRLWDGETVPVPPELVEQMRAKPEPEPDPPWWRRASFWSRLFWWPLSPFRSRKH